MYKNLFSIKNELITAETPRKLFIEIGPSLLQYVIKTADNTICSLQYYSIEQKNEGSWMETVEDILRHKDLTAELWKNAAIIYHFPVYQLVPTQSFQANDPDYLALQLLHGDYHRGAVLNEKVQGWELQNVYQVPAALHQMLQRLAINGKHWHHASLLLEALHKTDIQNTGKIAISFYQNKIQVAVVQNGGLLLLQSFSYQVAEDVAYHLLNIVTQLNLTTETPLYVDGMIDVSSGMYTELEKYFTNIELASLPSGITEQETLQDYPAHFFSPMLKNIVCVS